MRSPTVARSRVRCIRLICCTALLVGSWVPLAPAATITVTTTGDELNGDGDCSLREAVSAAATDTAVDSCAPGSGADTILLPAGTFSLATVGTSLSLSGEVTLDGAGAAATVLEAAASPGVASFSVLRVEAGAVVTVRDVTIRHGVAGDNGIYCGGGGIFNAGTLRVLDSVVTQNSTGMVTGSLSGHGGGICSIGPLELMRCTISDNRTGAGAFWTGDGGGVATTLDASLVARHVTITGNRTGDGPHTGSGGGMKLNGPTSTIMDSSIVSNQTGAASSGMSGYGGGILSDRTALIERTLIAGNATGTTASSLTGLGGGMYNMAEITLRNCTISGNRTGNPGTGVGSGSGGGIVHQNDNPMVLHNCTITANATGTATSMAGSGGGIYSDGPSTPGDGTEAVIMNTIIANNSVGTGGAGPDCANYLLSSGYNLVQNTAGCTIASIAASDITGQTPSLGVLDDHGGPTLTHAVPTISPAYDAIPAGTNGCGGTVAADQRSAPRPEGGGCEMGAFEVGDPPIFRDDLESGETGYWTSAAGVTGG